MRPVILCLLVMLAGCTSAADDIAIPAAGTPFVEVLTGGGLYGYTRTRIWDGDITETGTQPSGVSQETVTLQQSFAGTFAAVATVVARLGPAAMTGVITPEDQCMDYGLDRVTANPPIDGFTSVQVTCPDPGVAALMAAINSAASGAASIPAAQ